MNIRFGKLKVSTPKVKVEQVEKYNYPVMTMHPAPTEVKGKYKFSLNKAALNLIPDNRVIDFGYTDENNNLLNAVIMGIFNSEHITGYKINAVGNFFSKQIHKDFCTFYGLSSDSETEFILGVIGDGILELALLSDSATVEAKNEGNIEPESSNNISEELDSLESVTTEGSYLYHIPEIDDFEKQANQPYI